MTTPSSSAPYGYCPICGEKGNLRERRPDGNDTCLAGHVYPAKDALLRSKDNMQSLLDDAMTYHLQMMEGKGHDATAGAMMCGIIVPNLLAYIETLRRWIRDLQSGMHVNCVYCGHRYGPNGDTPVSMADTLKEHIKKCPQHPMSLMENQRSEAARLLWQLIECLKYDSPDTTEIKTRAREIERVLSPRSKNG